MDPELRRYFEHRLEREREIAERCTDPMTARIHQRFVDEYRRRLSEKSEVPA